MPVGHNRLLCLALSILGCKVLGKVGSGRKAAGDVDGFEGVVLPDG